MTVPAATDTRASFGRTLDEAVAALTSFIVPLYTEGRMGRPEQFGSGFFLEAKGAVVLISAAHVLRQVQSRPVFYYTSRNRICNLDGRLVLGRGGGDDTDLIDVAGFVLSQEAELPQPETGKVAVPMSYLAPRYMPRTEKEYLIVGYPSSKNGPNPVKRSVTARPYAYHDRCATQEKYQQIGLSPANHIVMPLDLRNGFDSAGNRISFPKPQGLSGSPVWVLYEERPNEPQRTFPLVGVGIRYKKSEKVLVATDSQAIVELIDAAI